MADVTTQPRHAPVSRTSGLWAAWTILIAMGGTSVTYNVWHAVHGGHMPAGLALLYGLAPVAAAILLSHIVAEYDGGWFLQGTAFVIMLAAMSLSAYATAVTVAPVAGPVFAWVFGLTLDAAALVALRVILASRSRKAEAAAAAEAAHAELEAGRASVQQAIASAAALERELATVKTELGAELETVRGELETALQALTSARNRARSSGQKRRASSPRNKAAASALKPDVPDDVDTQAEALRILGEEPGISGGELGRRLGKSERYGCMLKNRLTAALPGPDQETQ